MEITEKILLKIKEEIINDPENVGYKNKTNEEILMLLNKVTPKTVKVPFTLGVPYTVVNAVIELVVVMVGLFGATGDPSVTLLFSPFPNAFTALIITL